MRSLLCQRKIRSRISSTRPEPVTLVPSKTSNWSTVRMYELMQEQRRQGVDVLWRRKEWLRLFDAKHAAFPPFFHPHLETVEKFRETCHELTLKLLRCFAISFGLDKEYFANGALSSMCSDFRS